MRKGVGERGSEEGGGGERGWGREGVRKGVGERGGEEGGGGERG